MGSTPLPTPERLDQLRELILDRAPIDPAFDRSAIAHRLDEAQNALAQIDAKRLTVGFLGGTGVGKSTLLNAIAGCEISRPGERRPTTDRIVVHRHSDDPVPSGFQSADLSEAVEPHSESALRGIVLVDLPDIDGHKRSHRDRVHRVLPHLDVLLVVTSVDKYADLALYEELTALPQSPKNLVFVLGQIDRIAPVELDAVTDDFRSKLGTHAGLDDAVPVLRLSALRACESERRDEELAAIDALFDELGTDEERRRVLTENAWRRLHRLDEALEEALPRDRLTPLIESLASEPFELPEIDRARLGALERELEESIGPWMAESGLRASGFPIGFLHFVVQRHWDRSRKRRAPDPFSTGFDAARSHFEEFAERPIRIARKRLELAGSDLAPVTMRWPTPEWSSPIIGESLGGWIDALRRRAPKLGWRFRQHIAPGLVVLATAAGIVAPLVAERESGGLLSRMRDAFVEFATRLEPTQWIIVGAAVAFYYVVLYPYYLFVLDRRVTAEALRGAELATRAWRESVEEKWCEPARQAAAELRDWWHALEAERATIQAKGRPTKA